MIYADSACIFAAVCAALFCVFGVVGKKIIQNIPKNIEEYLFI